MRRSPSQFDAFNRCSTGAAVLSSAVVDPGLTAVLAIDAFDIAEVAEGGAACANAVLEDLDDGAVEFGEFGLADAMGGAGGENTAEEEGFVSVDVTDASDEALVEEGIFDGAATFLEAIAQVFQGKIL